MKIRLSTFILCSLALVVSFSFGQTTKHLSASHLIDSLEKEIIKAKTDTAKIRILIQVSNFYDAKDSLQAFQRCGEAMKIAKRINDIRMEGMVLNQIGKKYSDYGYSDKAIGYFENRFSRASSSNCRHAWRKAGPG